MRRAITRLPSRRDVLRGLLAAGVGAGVLRRPEAATAKQRRRKVRRNAFGCVDVGDFCKNDGQCCSGICEGKQGKRKCRAHDTGGCRAGFQDTSCDTPAEPGTDVSCTTGGGDPGGFCNTTTGNAGFCTASGGCQACTTDAECEATQGPGAACILCAKCAETGGTSCARP